MSENSKIQAFAQDVSVVAEGPSIKEKIRSYFSNRLINRICVLLLAVVLLALSLAPLMRCEIEWDGYETQYLEFSGTDIIKMTGLLSNNEIPTKEETPNEKISFVEWSGELLSERTIGKVGTKLSIVLSAFLFILYVLAGVVLLVVSIIDLILEYIAVKKKRKGKNKYVSDLLLPLMFCIFPAVCFGLAQSVSLYVANAAIGTNAVLTNIKMAMGTVLVLILSLLGGAFACVAHSFGRTRVNVRYFSRIRVKHIICIGLVLLAVIFSFLPCIQIKTFDPETATERTVGLSLWDIRQMTREERSVYQSSVRVDLEYVNDGEKTGEDIVNAFLMTSQMPSVRMMYIMVEIAFLIELILIGLLLWLIIGRGFFEAGRLKTVGLFKILTIISAGLNLIFVIVFHSLIVGCVWQEMRYFIDFKLGAGIVLSSVCILVAVVLSLKGKSEDKEADDDYDNPDVSYAPYVLYTKK